MNPMLQKLVDSEFMTQEQGEVIQKAVDAKDSVIASGHRSAAVRPLLATLMAMTKPYTSKKIKSLDDIVDDVDIFYYPDLMLRTSKNLFKNL